MEILKLTSRSRLAWQCLCQASSKGIHTTAAAASVSLINQKTVKGSYRVHKQPQNYSLFGGTPTTNSFGSAVRANKLYFFSTEASVNKEAENLASEAVSSSEERLSESEGNSSSGATGSDSASQTGELLPSEQEAVDWDNKLDKLYKQVELEVLAYEPSVLDSYQWFVISAARHLGIKVGKCWSPLKSNKLRFKLLKSAFVHKKHVVHYEVRTHHRFIILHQLTSSTADTFLEYIERSLPEDVGLKVTRVEAKALPDYLQMKNQQ